MQVLRRTYLHNPNKVKMPEIDMEIQHIVPFAIVLATRHKILLIGRMKANSL